jgi:glycosyltransferase involved in cell wall biosynthesis
VATSESNSIPSELNNRKLLLAVGMHRSGTSALARGLQVLGADLGDNLEPPIKGVNDTGFWEDIEFNALNTDLLHSLGHDWQSLYLIGQMPSNNQDVNSIRARASVWLHSKFTHGNFIALKNPRASRLLSFWKPVFWEQGVDLGLIIVIRNPKSVAESLKKRDGLLPEQSYMLWLEHVLSAVVESRDTPTVVVDYDRLMEDPIRELHRIGAAFNLATDEGFTQRANDFSGNFLRDGLRHTTYSKEGLRNDPKVPLDVWRLFEVMYATASDEIALDSEDVRIVVENATQRLIEYAPVLGCITQLHAQATEFKNLYRMFKDENTQLHEQLKEQWSRIRGQMGLIQDQQVRLSELEDQFRSREAELIRVVNARDHRVAQLQHEIEGYLNSTSWRITLPIRKISYTLVRLRRLGGIYSNYRSIYPGRHGLFRLISRVSSSVQKGGVSGLRQKTVEHVHSRIPDSLDTKNTQSVPILLLEDRKRNQAKTITEKIAVHAHLYYLELADDLAGFLANIPCSYDLYVSTDTAEKARGLADKLSGLEGVGSFNVQVTPNRGRDVAPMIVTFGAVLSNYSLILHVHTKRSPHNPRLRGWRRFLYETLLGTPELVWNIIGSFIQDKSLGIFYPAPYYPVRPLMKVGGNERQMRWLLDRSSAGNTVYDEIDKTHFPASSMFWLRGEVIQGLVDMSLSYDDFDEEIGQVDGTLAHAIERLFPWFAQQKNLTSKVYLPKCLNVKNYPGAIPIDQLFDRLNSKGRDGFVLIFDHGLGGGANLYNDQRIEGLLNEQMIVLRVFCEGGGWFVEWIEDEDGLLGVTLSTDNLFSALDELSYNRIIVNSLFDYPGVERVISKLCTYVERSETPLEYIVHDFYSLCPSQHLLDYRERYCGVPQDENKCSYCLERNIAATQKVNISHWRKLFASLMQCANQVTVFDESTLDILGRGIDLRRINSQIEAQSLPNFGCEKPVSISGGLHIGIIGTMTTVKGAAKVNQLAAYIRQNGLQVPITVVGRSLVPMDEGVRVLGHYEIDSLPEIIRREGINTYFMSTIVPETYSRTLSEAMALRLPIIAYDIGAQGARTGRYSLGRVLPLDASIEELFDAVQQLFDESKGKLH